MILEFDNNDNSSFSYEEFGELLREIILNNILESLKFCENCEIKIDSQEVLNTSVCLFYSYLTSLSILLLSKKCDPATYKNNRIFYEAIKYSMLFDLNERLSELNISDFSNYDLDRTNTFINNFFDIFDDLESPNNPTIISMDVFERILTDANSSILNNTETSENNKHNKYMLFFFTKNIDSFALRFNKISLITIQPSSLGEVVDNFLEEEDDTLSLSVVRKMENDYLYSISYEWSDLIYTLAYDLSLNERKEKPMQNLRAKGLFPRFVRKAIADAENILKTDLETIKFIINYEKLYTNELDKIQPGWRNASFKTRIELINHHKKSTEDKKHKEKSWWGFLK